MTLLLPALLFDGTNGAPKPNMGVLIKDGLIAEVGEAKSLKSKSSDEKVLDGTLMPGMIDCHTHLVLAATADPAKTLRADSRSRTVLRGVRHMAQHLLAGVTTIRDLGGFDGIDLELMRLQASGALMGPRVMASGALIAMTGGHACFLGVECDGVDEVRKAVRLQLKRGASQIKVVATGGVISQGVEPGSPQLTEAELTAAVEEAVKAGRKVAAHAQGTVGIMNALKAGVHTVEHAFWLDEACVSRMASQQTAMVATFAAAAGMMDHLSELPDFIRQKMEKLGDAHRQSFVMARDGGVVLLAGTDAGTPFNPHGTLFRELELMVAHGATPLQALHGATGAAAMMMGRDDLGTIAPGKKADLVLLQGNPSEQISATRQVRQVWQGGMPVDADALRGVLKVIPQSDL